jgi:hypothetical protein
VGAVWRFLGALIFSPLARLHIDDQWIVAGAVQEVIAGIDGLVVPSAVCDLDTALVVF